jgi:myb proto-oncogene protein
MNVKEQIKKKINRNHKNNRHYFTKDEDEILKKIKNNSEPKTWNEVASYLPGRYSKQCRDRWLNYLAPWIKKEKWTTEEDEIIKKIVKEKGNKWSYLQEILPGRTDNDIKNRWYNYLRKEHKEETLPKIDFWTEIEAASVHFVDIDFDHLSCSFI